MLILNGCKKTSTVKLDEMISVDDTLKYAGAFKGYGSEKVSGEAKVYLTNNKYMLKLENFSASNGPDLKVYLSTASSPSEFISLGSLKSTNGNQVYEISGTPDFTKHKFVLIHCERYNHLFGSAEMK
ncbi:MAG TPA: DM13 domain-containing protein [Sphingobacteriaceae bacterium]|nr:DM13 domain-containing protein [Sphingobacteriaceae bacterium]